MRRTHDPLVINGDIDEELVQLDVLLRARPDQVMKGEPSQGEHGLAVELGVVEAVEQMDTAGSAGCQADAQFSGVLGVTASHERSRFFVPYVDELDLILSLAQRFHDAVNAIAR